MLATPGAAAREEMGAWLAGVFCGVLVGSMLLVAVDEYVGAVVKRCSENLKKRKRM
jgi:hypothetical protein